MSGADPVSNQAAPSSPTLPLLAALKECDFLLHGSGPGFVGQKEVAKWREETGKPYGIYCITYSGNELHTKELLSGAKFVYFRDSVSLKFAKDVGISSPIMEFCPEGSFAVDLRNDAAADAFLKEHQKITTQEFKELVAATRKYTIPLGEYFDQEKVTLRVGDLRRKR